MNTDLIGVIVSSFLFVFGLPFILQKLSDTSSIKSLKREGWTFLQVAKEYKYLGIVCIFCSVGVILVTHFAYIDNQTLITLIIGWLITTFFILTGIYLIIWHSRCYALYNEELLKFQSTFGKMKQMRWLDVKSISYNHTMGRLVFKDANKTFAIDTQLKGFTSFVKFIKKRIPAEIYSDALDKISK